jgi:predicted nucleic acid-binding protein
MRNKAHDLAAWLFRGDQRILPDANFWLNVLSPSFGLARPRHSRDYSSAYRRLLLAKSSLFVDVLIMSEFVNVLARQSFTDSLKRQYVGRHGHPDFKAYRNSADFVAPARIIASECRKILRQSIRLDHAFSEWDFGTLLSGFESGGEDFNDQLLIEMARKHSLLFLTDDADMVSGGLEVLTANRRLLAACPT